MKKIKTLISILLAILLMVGTIPFAGMLTSAETVTPDIVELSGGKINLAINGDFEADTLDSSQETVKSKNGEEKISVGEISGNRYLVMPAPDGEQPNQAYAFSQSFVGLDTSKSYTLSFRFKTENTKSGWAFMAGLYDNVASLGSTTAAKEWHYVTPTSVNVPTAGATFTTDGYYGGLIQNVTSTDWQKINIVFTPNNAWTSLVITPYVADLGNVCIDDIVLTENTVSVYNGDFESDQDSDFGFTYGSVKNQTAATMPQVVASSVCGGNGDYSLYVPGYSYVMQEVPNLKTGKTYRYSYNVYLPEAVTSWTVMSSLQRSKPSAGNLATNPYTFTLDKTSGIAVTADYGGVISYASAKTWYTVTQTFTVPNEASETAYIYILGWYGKDSYYDDFSIVEVDDGNHVVNGDFEDANYNGFTTNNAKLVTAQSVGANGKYALYLPNDGTTKSQVWQMVTGLTAGQKYYFTYKIRLATTSTGWTLFNDIYNYRPSKLANPSKTSISRKAFNLTDGFNYTDESYYGLIATNGTASSTKWQSIVIPFTANATVAYINFFHFSNNVPDIYIDDIAVVENNGVYMTNSDFSKGTADYAVSDDTACLVSEYDDVYGNTLIIPKSSKDTVTARKLSKAILGLTVGEIYSFTFDIKLDNYETPTALDWIALAGLSTVKPHLNGNTAHFYNVRQPAISSFSCQSSSGSFNKSTEGDYGYIQYNSSTEWMTYEVRFIAESEEVYFYIENNYGKADLVLDNITISKVEASSGEINYTPTEETEDTTSVMLMGNSFSQDTMREIQDVIDAGSADLRMAMFGKGDKNIEYFYNQYVLSNNQMEFWYAEKGKSGQSLIQLSDTTFDSAFSFLDWDYVVLQATTGGSDILTANYNLDGLKTFIDVIKTELPNSEIILYVPWAYTQEYIDANENGYTTVADQLAAYEAYEIYIAEQTGCRTISAVNAIENIRNIEGVGKSGVTRDGFHLNAIGATTVGLKFYEYFTGIDVRTIDYTKTYFPYDTYTNGYTGDIGTTLTQEQLLAIKTGVHATFVDYIRGDANDDKQVDIIDLVVLKKHVCNIKLVKNDIAGDLDLSGVINASDLTSLRILLLNK